MADVQQHFFLRVQMHELILFQYFLLPHYFEGIYLLPAPELNQFNPPESAVAERGQHL